MRCEWLVHVMIHAAATVTVILSIHNQVYNPGGTGMLRYMVSQYPPNCQRSPLLKDLGCIRGEQAWTTNLFSLVISWILLYLFCNLTFLLIYAKARQRWHANRESPLFRAVELQTAVYLILFAMRRRLGGWWRDPTFLRTNIKPPFYRVQFALESIVPLTGVCYMHGCIFDNDTDKFDARINMLDGRRFSRPCFPRKTLIPSIYHHQGEPLV